MSAPVETPTLSDVRLAIVRHLIDNVESTSISISEVNCAVRRVFPLCELTDWELDDLIARSAIGAGFAIDFDAGGSWPYRKPIGKSAA
ncbi:hypothetical protein FJ976_01670 [Mesorhizobium sp. B1-1-9]|nr:hypothetical protein FJ978_04385 [Mesorhizobium sp. B1-1-7]TPN58644.1 hypothetical protein FJ976_01670 [Mesorhizobium sp. B1-1-9]